MTRLFKNWKSLYKGVLFALAFIMAFTFVPMDAIELLAQAATGPADKNYNTITLTADAKTSVPMGGEYEVKYATFKAANSENGTYKIGSGGSSNGVTASSIKVAYKGTKDYEEIVTNGQRDENTYGIFKPKRVGTYTITYSVTTNDKKTYTYDYDITCTIAKSSFNFYDLKKQDDGTYVTNGNLPSVYDLNYLSKLTDKTDRDITLPLPTVLDEKGKEFENVKYIVENSDELDSTGNVVVLSLAAPKAETEAKIEKATNEKDFVIKADSLQEVGNYTITYTFKQNGQYVDSIQKTFEVKNGYYYKDSEKKDAGYTLETEWATSVPTTAVTNVKQQLPKINGRTSSTNSPSKEAIPVSYTIKVQRKGDDNKYADVVDEGYIVVEQDNYYFQPKQDGDYLITYSVWDYYTGSAEKPAVSTDKTYIEIKDVKDTQLPTVYVYDANPDYAKDGDEYKSAAAKLKSVTPYNNIILYAVGGKDNSADELELTRSIIDNGSVERFTTTKYADKNLILQFTTYEDLLRQNYALRHDIEIEKDADDKVDFKFEQEPSTKYTADTITKIQAWLKNHNYLIVTNSLETVPDANETDGKKDFTYGDGVTTDEQKIKALEDAGYAYVNYDHKFTNAYTSSEDGTVDDRTSTYTVRYEARDQYAKDNNNQARISYSMKLASETYTDKVAPTITGPNTLHNSYIDNDTITFAAPTASDPSDSTERLDVITAYRFLGSNGNAIERGNGADETLEFTPGDDVNSDTYEKKESKGWYFVEKNDDGQISIDLTTKPQDATRVQILIYAVDDYGNIGQWKKTIDITNTGDSTAPTIVSITENKVEGLQQGDKVTLPTIQYTDDRVGFMTAQVIIENIQTKTEDDGSVTEVARHTLSNQNMNASPYPYMGLYTVDAGSFVASYSGDYIVTIVARDGGGHSIATYFEYSVKAVIRVEDVKIDNIYETNINRRVTAPFEIAQNEDGIYRLTTPTLSLPNVEGYTFAGVSELDDANTALDYYINVISNDGRYNPTATYFQGLDAGTYKFQYMVKLISVETAKLQARDGQVSIDETTGRVKITDNGDTYYVYVNKDGTLGANKKEYGNATNNKDEELNVAESTIEKKYSLQGFVLPSEVITLTFSSADAPVVTIDPGKIKAQYAEVGTEIVLPRISASTASGVLDQDKSRVVIQAARAGGTSTLATIKMSEWETNANYKSDQKELVYNLEYNGTYTITYYAVEKGSSAEGTKVITIKNGDTISPELNLNVKDGFMTDANGNKKKSDEFKLKDDLFLHTDKITATDKGGSVEDDAELKDKIEISVKLDGKEVEHTQDGDTYSCKLDTAGDYVVTVTVTDNAGWRTQDTVTISVKPESSEATITYETIGTILIVISAVILAGVIGYFIYSKVKLDKETKKIK